ncbi:MAG: pyridoxamine 5'-phosphate oxidase family protein [Thalassovita sp.]
MTSEFSTLSDAPFHQGEIAVQLKTGKRDPSDSLSKAAIRPFMPDQHRAFFEQIPFVVAGSVDAEGWPWASILAGGEGFITSPDPRRLDIDFAPIAEDPLSKALTQGAPIGLLGIELPTRRRNRMNARVIAANKEGFSLGVDVSFGNCPQYIQTRDVEFVRAPSAPVTRSSPTLFTALDAATSARITQADTFFVSSFAHSDADPIRHGVDVSHRGGRPGFVKVEGNTLTIPDYSGNNFFNTFGNFLLNAKAGLLFPDFTTGDVLMLTGTVEILWEDDPEVQSFDGAERGWRFHLDHGRLIEDALPIRANFLEYSPNSLLAGDWAKADARRAAEALRNSWQPMRISDIQDESSVIRSFTFAPQDGSPPLAFDAGQFVTLRVTPQGESKPQIRTYTVSSAPSDPAYRISVKREVEGVVSKHLHDRLKVGDVIEVKAPKGRFTLDPSVRRPAVLLAGGVGITPMLSMARHVVHEGKRTRYTRPVTVFHAAHDTAQRAFERDFRALEVESRGAIRYFSFVSNVRAGQDAGVQFNGQGRITAGALRQVLPLDDYDFYLCGPKGFMQAMYDILRSLGVADARIEAEAFGPSALVRDVEQGQTSEPAVEEATDAVIEFTKAGFEQSWSAGEGTLLDTAEAHGLTPDFSCRSGTCGSCLTRKLSGEVTYRTQPTAEHSDDEVLICCAVPAKGTGVIKLDL